MISSGKLPLLDTPVHFMISILMLRVVVGHRKEWVSCVWLEIFWIGNGGGMLSGY